MQAAVTGGSDEGTFEKARPMEESTDKAAMWRASSRAPTTRPKLGAAGVAVCLFICFYAVGCTSRCQNQLLCLQSLTLGPSAVETGHTTWNY